MEGFILSEEIDEALIERLSGLLSEVKKLDAHMTCI